MSKKRLIVFTGAGMSAESGIPTFRGSDGLWENYRMEDVATPEAWQRDPALVMKFYNERRKGVLAAQPNAGHLQIAQWQDAYDVTVVTQNIDDLHERAGSLDVVHVHGEIMKSRSSLNAKLVYPIAGWELRMGELCEQGSQLRPHIVWFGEDVPMLDYAAAVVEEADIFIVVGTSLQVYPAAALIHHAFRAKQKFIVDPNAHSLVQADPWVVISQNAGEGLTQLNRLLLQ